MRSVLSTWLSVSFWHNPLWDRDAGWRRGRGRKLMMRWYYDAGGDKVMRSRVPAPDIFREIWDRLLLRNLWLRTVRDAFYSSKLNIVSLQYFPKLWRMAWTTQHKLLSNFSLFSRESVAQQFKMRSCGNSGEKQVSSLGNHLGNGFGHLIHL